MDTGYEVRYIKTKKKLRKIVTYADDDQGNRIYHEKVVDFLRKHTNDSIFAKAYVRHSSIEKNAKAHMYNDIFVKLDVKDFFNSINHKYMADCLFREINKNTLISYRECCEVVRRCSAYGEKGLPLGLVSSPDLANLYLKEFDGLFYGFIKTLNLVNPIYTRYADDLVVSYKGTETEVIDVIIEKASDLLARFHLNLNRKKTQIIDITRSNFVRITGVNIIRKADNYRHLSVGNKLKNELFWKVLDAYDNPKNHSYQEINQYKGKLSFILSIEKKGFDQLYSEGMKSLLAERGFADLIEMTRALETHKRDSEGNDVNN